MFCLLVLSHRGVKRYFKGRKNQKQSSAFYDFSGHSVLKNKNPQLPINQNHVHEGSVVSGGSVVMYSGLPSWYQKPELRAPGGAILAVCLNCGCWLEEGCWGRWQGILTCCPGTSSSAGCRQARSRPCLSPSGVNNLVALHSNLTGDAGGAAPESLHLVTRHGSAASKYTNSG